MSTVEEQRALAALQNNGWPGADRWPLLQNRLRNWTAEMDKVAADIAQIKVRLDALEDAKEIRS